LGLATAVAGFVALTLRQPYAVWFLLLLFGLLLPGILIPRLRDYQRHYEALELRRMTSLDAMRG
jgi:hypothetical protein